MNSMSAIDGKSTTKENNLNMALVFFVMAILYDISPIDLIPDVPVVGWVDDFFITVTAGLNLLEKSMAGTNSTLAAILRYVKWGVIFIGIIAVVLVGFGVYGLVKLIAG